MGLNHPVDLAAWSRWQSRSSPYRRLRAALRPSTPTEPMHLAIRGSDPQVLIALDATTPTSIAAYLRPLAFLDEVSLAVLAPRDVLSLLPGTGWRSASQTISSGQMPAELNVLSAVLAAGHYLNVGAKSLEWANAVGAQFFIAQHGLVTPFAPPLPRRAHLLAFSTSDATFWASGRQDITHDVVGSQLLWAAERSPSVSIGSGSQPVFLGQLHGAELPRRGLAKAATSFFRETGATYRPHPSEIDKLSRLQHALWARQGMDFDNSKLPLAQLARPVVSVFSTGVLEAAARGIPSWVTYDSPPTWLIEFWNRYSLSRWGSDPTPALVQPAREPAESIARVLQSFVKGTS